MKKLLRETHPNLKEEWDVTANAGFRYDDAFTTSHRRVWWICKNNPEHKWQAKIRGRTVNGYGCPYCSGRFIAPERSLAVLYPEVAAEWHPGEIGDVVS